MTFEMANVKMNKVFTLKYLEYEIIEKLILVTISMIFVKANNKNTVLNITKSSPLVITAKKVSIFNQIKENKIIPITYKLAEADLYSFLISFMLLLSKALEIIGPVI